MDLYFSDNATLFIQQVSTSFSLPKSIYMTFTERWLINVLLFKMFIFVKGHFTIFFEAQHSTRTTVWILK
jgi:hypothetical protein